MATTTADRIQSAKGTAKDGATPPKPLEDAPGSDLAAWFQARQKPIGIALGAVFLVGLVTWYVVESGRRKQAQALGALDQARTAVEAQNYPEASSQLQKIAESYSGTDAALEAVLVLNQVRMMSGQGQLAVDELKKFIATNPPGAYGAAAHSHLAMALENTGKPAEAVSEYLKAAELAPEGFRKVDAMLAAARLHRQQGKPAEAAKIYQEIIAKYAKETAGVSEAEVRLAEIAQAGVK